MNVQEEYKQQIEYIDANNCSALMKFGIGSFVISAAYIYGQMIDTVYGGRQCFSFLVL
jgi:hypothetical protein